MFRSNRRWSTRIQIVEGAVASFQPLLKLGLGSGSKESSAYSLSICHPITYGLWPNRLAMLPQSCEQSRDILDLQN